ncbi:MAG TPA: ribonuclease III [Phycisphaerales bacterium]|nr:ribonuclease III [Phycisphaerales bacterium]HCD31379.1 ribonuclease III [Phycisphaerales bacterium]|tara:strand:+ start:145085 stop:145834 length:750 start_codon:yes stop_codon:yes gene_type:complete
MQELEAAQEALGYQFKNLDILRESLTHASVTDNRLQSNERLEFLGDSILGYVICQYLYDTFPEELEGELTKIKSAVVSRRICAKISAKLKLGDYLIVGKGMNGRSALPQSILAGVYESVIAALYIDGGMEPARDFILKHMVKRINEAATSNHQQNFKSALQHYAQRAMPTNPSYLLLDEKGPDHSKCFEVCVEIDGQRFESAWANSKKEAEQAAAKAALTQLGMLEEDEDGILMLKDDPTPENVIESET